MQFHQIVKKIVIYILTWEAKAVVKKYKPFVIAVTGSVGKTSTKDAIYEVIGEGVYARKSQKSFNSEVGLPLTILGLANAWNNPLGWLQNIVQGGWLLIKKTKYPQVLVLEVGADRPGDIQSVAKWLPVDVAVITRLPEVPVHVEFFDSAEEVVNEKAALIDALVPDGTLVLYGGARAGEFRARAGEKRVVTFGLANTGDIYAKEFTTLFAESGAPRGMQATIGVGGARAVFEVIGTLGSHSLLPALAAVAVGVALKKDLHELLGALKAYTPPPGRMRLLKGVKETTLIDDTYNSSPAAVVAALDALAALGGRKIAVLGDMLELGRHSVEEHRKLGAYVANKVDMLVTVGVRAKDIASGALDNGLPDATILQFERAEQAGEELEMLIEPGDTILVKGSQSMRMEKVVKKLMANPERAKELLVRQEGEWTKR